MDIAALSTTATNKKRHCEFVHPDSKKFVNQTYRWLGMKKGSLCFEARMGKRVTFLRDRRVLYGLYDKL